MIEVVQGSPGSGKSAVAVARAIEHLSKGGVVAANFRLVDQWSNQVAKRHIFSSFSGSFRYKRALSLYDRFLYVDSLPAVMAIDPRKQAVGVYKDDGSYSEGSGLLILDECQLIFNSRKWDKNFSWIEFFTQHRKLGWHVILIAHSIEMIDSQIRPLAEYSSTFRNLQKVRLPIIGLPLSPIPAFLTIRRYAGLGAGANAVHSRELYKLPLWAARLYDSLLVFSAERWLDDTLPSTCGDPPALLCGAGGYFDVLVNWWANIIPAKRKLSKLSDTCLWSKYHDQNENVLLLTNEVKTEHLWPLSLNHAKH